MSLSFYRQSSSPVPGRRHPRAPREISEKRNFDGLYQVQPAFPSAGCVLCSPRALKTSSEYSPGVMGLLTSSLVTWFIRVHFHIIGMNYGACTLLLSAPYYKPGAQLPATMYCTLFPSLEEQNVKKHFVNAMLGEPGLYFLHCWDVAVE